jgi:hypothetical protein
VFDRSCRPLIHLCWLPVPPLSCRHCQAFPVAFAAQQTHTASLPVVMIPAFPTPQEMRGYVNTARVLAACAAQLTYIACICPATTDPAFLTPTGDAGLRQHCKGAAEDAADAAHTLTGSHHHPVNVEGLGPAPQVAACVGGARGAEAAPAGRKRAAEGEWPWAKPRGQHAWQGCIHIRTHRQAVLLGTTACSETQLTVSLSQALAYPS